MGINLFLCSIWNDCCIDVGGSDYGMKLLLSNANCENHNTAFITVHAYIPITIEWPNTDLIQAFPFLRTHVLWSINAHQWKDSYRISQYCQNALKPNGQKKLYKMYRYKKKCFDDDSILCQYWGIRIPCREWEKLNGTMITKSSTVHSWNSQNNTKCSLIHFWNSQKKSTGINSM